MTEEEVERKAKEAFHQRPTGQKGWSDKQWEDLEEWMRESWRCEVDEDRSLDRLLQLTRRAKIDSELVSAEPGPDWHPED